MPPLPKRNILKKHQVTRLNHVYPDAFLPATGPVGKDLPYFVFYNLSRVVANVKHLFDFVV